MVLSSKCKTGLLRTGAGVLALAALAALTAFTESSADADRGKQLFEKRCTGCHSLERNKEGPRLGDVFGRHVGTAPGFDYSAGMKSAGFTWDETRLDQWLTDTDSVVADNKMDFHVPKPDERADIIRYLKLISPAQKSAANPTPNPTH